MVKHDEILAAINSRKTWEDRQTTWYQMRHDGLRRAKKPWPGAADMHFPLADTTIEKLKPFYVQQIFASETIAQFTGVDQSAIAYQTAAGQFFDDHLKQKSNFEESIVIAVDRFLQGGCSVVKVFWDIDRKCLRWDPIQPTHVIVPPWTTAIDQADWIVHVQVYSKAAYKQMKAAGFLCDDETIQRIVNGSTDSETYEQAKRTREGITHSSDKEQIIVWEKWSRNDQGQIEIEYYSPAAPELILKPKMGMMYAKGIFAEPRPPYPFFRLSAELKDQGFYDSRGICERAAAFEASLNKDWNTAKDYQTLTTQPTYFAPGGIAGHTGNIQMIPGQILPFEIQAVTYPQVPVDLQASMVNTRLVFEQSIAMPDFGTGSPLQTNQRKTATEISAMTGVMGQSTDLRARIFKRELAKGLRMGWAILSQMGQSELKYYYLDELRDLDPKALDGSYRIEPSGSGDSFNKERAFQEAMALFQMFKGDPDIDQVAIKKHLIELKNPRLVKEWIRDQGTASAMQIEDQAQEITAMLIGFPAQVRPTDDDLAHISSVLGFLNKPNNPVQPSPEAIVLIAQHVAGHIAQWKKAKPDQFRQEAPKLTQQLQQLQIIAQNAQQQMAATAAPQQLAP